VKIRSVRHNNRKTSTKILVFPFSKASPTPTTEAPVTELTVDPEAPLGLLQVLNCDVDLVVRTKTRLTTHAPRRAPSTPCGRRNCDVTLSIPEDPRQPRGPLGERQAIADSFEFDLSRVGFPAGLDS
jgi:hypothetical protein